MLRLVVPSMSVNFLDVIIAYSAGAVGGAVCHGLVSLLIVPWELCDLRLRVDMVMFPTDPPPGVQS